MQSEIQQSPFTIQRPTAHSFNPGIDRHSCHCAFAIYANIPVVDERGRYCSACGHYEFLETTRKQ